jgi:predicted kinase
MPETVPLELVLFVGLPASGKTTFFRERFAQSHVHVSKDLWPNARNRDLRQTRLLEESLGAGRSVVVDNTNPSPAVRAPVIALARRFGARVTGFYFESLVPLSLERNSEREGRARVPDVAIHAIATRLIRPARDEGFDDLWHVCIREGRFVVEPWKEGLSR